MCMMKDEHRSWRWQTFKTRMWLCMTGSKCAMPYELQISAVSHPASWARICKCFRSPGIDSASLCSLAGTLRQIRLLYRSASWELIPGLLKKIYKYGLWRLTFGAFNLRLKIWKLKYNSKYHTRIPSTPECAAQRYTPYFLKTFLLSLRVKN